MRDWIVQSDPAARLSTIQTHAYALAEQLETERTARDHFRTKAMLQETAWLSAVPGAVAVRTLEDADIDALLVRVDHAIRAPETLHAWASYLARRSEAVRAGLESFCALVETGDVPSQVAADAYEAAVFRSLSEEVLRRDRQGLGAFSGPAHEQTRRIYQQYDHKLIECVRAEITYQLLRTTPQFGVGYGRVAELTGEALIRHEAEKTRRHIAIREVFRRAGRAILSLKPCFLMGPQAVAQYLAPGVFQFDLIVMDEASQMRPEDALGAIVRGNQLVVVGDPKQLGPTRFFDRVDDDEDEFNEAIAQVGTLSREATASNSGLEQPAGASVLERSESILHAAAARYPTRVLRWHYRSRHPKLIAFSNREFYGEKLILFPTVNSTPGIERGVLPQG